MSSPLRVADLEVLFTANTDQIDKAETKVQTVGKKIESKPVTATVIADDKGALAGMDRVEQAAKRLVSKDTIATVDANIERGEKNLDRVQKRLDYLHSVETELDVSADIKRAEASLQRIERNVTALRTARTTMEVDADPADALAALAKVEQSAKRLVSRDTAIRVNANIGDAEASIKAIEKDLAYLRALDPTVSVGADVRNAEAKLAGARAALRDLQGARAEMVVDVNEGGAKQKLRDVADYASDAGEDTGEKFGVSVITALASIPIVGAVIGIGVAAGKALIDGFQDGLQVEVGYDRLQALTGVDEPTALRLGRGAAEAYASGFGDSIESNMDTARLGLQFDLIDPAATTRDSQKVVEGLSGIADVLEEDVRPAAAAVATMLRTGVAVSAEDAFDILATGAREGANRSEDLLDTFTEYPALFKRLGLSGQEALGLVTQGLRAGARNSDLAADALKEFQIRATDASESSAEGFRVLGLDAADMTARIAAGGESARVGLDLVLDKLRETEDPVLRNAAAVALFGTQAEDLGEALFAMDLSTAVDQLNGVTGSAQRMFDTLADNDAAKLEQAGRNIEVAADGIKGALAVAFAEPLGDFADWVSQNRGPLLQFFLDLANGALDFASTAAESTGEFVSGPLADLVEGLAGVIDVFNGLEGRPKELDELAGSMRDFDKTTDGTVATIEQMRDRLNDFAEPQVTLGHLNDASLRLAGALDDVGSSSGTMEEQVRRAAAALSDEISAADAAGESQANLADRYRTGTQALVDQMVQTGMSEEAARALIDTVLATPAEAVTEFSSNADLERAKVQALDDRIVTLSDGTVVIRADASPAETSMETFFRRWNGTTVAVNMNAREGRNYANGAIVEFMANGGIPGIPGLTPMAPIAQMVPPSTFRVVGDRSDVDELYTPLDGSRRSWELLAEGFHRMPGSPPGSPAAAATGSGVLVQFGDIVVQVEGTDLSPAELEAVIRRAVPPVVREEMNRTFGTRGGL